VLTGEELERVRYYWTILTAAQGDIAALSPEESRELHLLLEKWLEQHRYSPLPKGGWIEARVRAQELIDRLLPGSKYVEFEAFRVPIPRWVSELTSNPEERLYLGRERAVELVAESSWAKGWAEGMLRTFHPEFETWDEVRREEEIKKWARKLAEKVIKV